MKGLLERQAASHAPALSVPRNAFYDIGVLFLHGIGLQRRPDAGRPLADPSMEPSLWHALRRGLFDVCKSYSLGDIAAGEYATALAAYPALVLQLAALQALDGRAPHKPTTRAIATLYRHLASNPALRLLCKWEMKVTFVPNQ